MPAADLTLTLPGDSTPTAEAAELYVCAGLPPIPLYGLRADGTCMCGSSSCQPRNRGKHPIGGGWQKQATIELDAVRDRFRNHVGNVGIYLPLGRLVLIDADGELGLATIATWQLPETLSAQSGSGTGAHFIYRLATHHDAGAITDRSKIEPGVDIKAHGQFVAAPSRHASGGVYRWTLAVAPTVLPDWLYDRIRKHPVGAGPVDPPSGLHMTADALERRARAYVAKIPGAIQGSGGSDQTFDVARRIAGFVAQGLPTAIGWNILVEYSARCQPPWSERELQHKWQDAQAAHTPFVPAERPAPRLRVVRSGDAPPSEPPTGEPPAPPDGPPHDWRGELRYATTRGGQDRLITDTENLQRVLQLDPRWAGKITFDEFRHRICLAPDLPWDKYEKPTTHLGYWTDEDAVRMSGWMRRDWHGRKFEPTKNDCEHAAIVVARTHDFHPVREYLDGLEWDGETRLSSWLTTYLGAEASEYTRLVGTWWLISAVGRVFDPGCKVDTVPILEGPQGLRKSTALKILAGAEFFNDTPLDLGSKDAYSAIQGCWFVELAELDSLMRVEATRAKAFFSSGKDKFRKAYARHEREEMRQCIFVGTTNLSEYLGDPTGARRFWPILCTAIRLAELEADRDQLWAEALAEYREGRKWYPETQTENTLLGEPQAMRTKTDAWEDAIAGWLSRQPSAQVRLQDILRDGLNLEQRDWTQSTQTRVAVLMTTKLGWQKRRVRTPDGLRWIYEPKG